VLPWLPEFVYLMTEQFAPDAQRQSLLPPSPCDSGDA
jgi:hypothetical protein